MHGAVLRIGPHGHRLFGEAHVADIAASGDQISGDFISQPDELAEALTDVGGEGLRLRLA
jgi:hypothetical protein